MELLRVIQMFLLVTTTINAVSSARKKIQKLPTYDCTCGQIGRKIPDRIVGGKETKPYEYPWQALVISGIVVHGGTVINDFYTLTGALGVYGMPIINIKVHLGVHNQSYVFHNRHQTYNVKNVKMHENFTIYSNDIALLQLNRRITFTDFVQPICLPNKNEKIEGKTVTVIGWGLTKWNADKLSSVLHETQVKVLTRKMCEKYNYYRDYTTFCTSSLKHDACMGDTGGPVFYKNQNGRAVQIGIVVSLDAQCGSGYLYGYRTTVSLFLDWIRKNTKPAHYCYKEI